MVRKFPLLLLCTLFVCAPAFAQQAAPQTDQVTNMALWVHEADAAKVESAVRGGLVSDDPKVRAVAARVANVRRLTNLVPLLRSRVDLDGNGVALREAIRALVMLGGAAEVERALMGSVRHGKRLHQDVAYAAARLGAPGMDLYFSRIRQLDVVDSDFFRLALWGRTQDVSAVAARMLRENDSDGFRSLLYIIDDEKPEMLDGSVAAAALGHKDTEIRTAAAWFVIKRCLMIPAPIRDARVKAAATAMPDPADDDDLFVAVELLRRLAGLPRRSTGTLKAALGGESIVRWRIRMVPRKVMDLLNEDEQPLVRGVLRKEKKEEDDKPQPYVLPEMLPEGVAASIVKGTGCRDGWIANAKTTVDASGRVLRRELSGVTATDACRRAVETLVALSLVEPENLTSPFDHATVSLVQSARTLPCLDEPPAGPPAVHHLGGGMYLRPPVLTNEVKPDYPSGSERKPVEVVIEATLSKSGCVRAARVKKPAPNPAFTRNALLAVSQWQFEPARIDSDPIELSFDVTVRFEP